MNSTRRAAPPRASMHRLWLLLLMPLAVARAPAADPALPYPPQLRRDVNFWVRVYTRIDTNAGYLHDQYNLSVIYDTLHFTPGSSPRSRQSLVNRVRDHYIAELRRIASGRWPLSPEEQRIKALWGKEATPSRLLEASHDIRFQLGQSNRFKAGLIRSGAWQQDIAKALREEGLPPQLAALPLVESSYNPDAYSRVGAAGLWQFMPSTGRRFMQIDRAVDDRMDPFIATKAAAQLLAYNYRILGTWPLALTAYNHGVAGVRRAVKAMGTTNIVTIVRHYHTRMFGFASRNFYVSFLAALKIDRDPQKYFGAIVPMREERFREVRMPEYVDIGPIERTLDIDPETLRELNPALRPAVWRGRLAVPRGYDLRLPADGPMLTSATLARRLGSEALLARAALARRAGARAGRIRKEHPSLLAAIIKPARARDAAVVAASTAPVYYSRVAFAPASPAQTSIFESLPSGESQPGHGATVGLASQGLLALNGLDGNTQGLPAVDAALVPRGPDGAPPFLERGHGPLGGTTDGSSGGAEGAQPVSAAQADALSPALAPAGGSSQNADPTDYSVAPNGTILVAAAENLGYYAEWLGVSAWDLRRINHLRFRQPVRVGERIRLDFRHVPPAQFVARRRDYHQALEASYFASHRIVGSQPYVTRRGDSLWTLTQRFSQVPLWLLREYNPDTDFADLRQGTQVVVPRIQDVSAGGG